MSDKDVYDVVWKPPASIDPKAKWQKIGVLVEYNDGKLKFHLNSNIPMSYIVFCANNPNRSWAMVYKRKEKEKGWDEDDSDNGYRSRDR